MGLQVDVFLCFMASLVTTGLSQIETDDVKVVEVEVSSVFGRISQ